VSQGKEVGFVATTSAGNRVRPRRTCLAVPGSSLRFLEKAQQLESDQVFLDLEDSVAPIAKEEARINVVRVLNEGTWGDRLRVVRVNDWTTQWTYEDVIALVGQAGRSLDCIMLPKIQHVSHVVALDLLLTQLERANGLKVGRIGIEAQIEDAEGLQNVDAIAASSPRIQCIVFGPADFMANLGMRSLSVGGDPVGYQGDAFHYIFMRVLVAARANGLQAIDGPFGAVKDTAGYRRVAERAAALGYDGKWVLHPAQIPIGNEVFSPTQAEYDQAENMVDAYDWHASAAGGGVGAVMLGDAFVDEATRKMAWVMAQRGRGIGMNRTDVWVPSA
jgi:citrate lyase subunit beta/citryl-CoA lyase